MENKKNNFRGFLKHTINYLSGDLFSKGINFLTIPIMTRILSTEDYGVLSIFTSLISIFTIFLGLSIESAIKRFYFEKKDEYKEMLGSNIVFLMIYNVVVLLIVNIFADRILDNSNSKILLSAVLVAMLNVFFQILLANYQVKQISIKFATLNAIKSVLIVVISILLILNINEKKYMGQVYAYLIITFVLFIYSLFKLRKESVFCLKAKYIIYSLKFSIPLIPSVLSSMLLTYCDRLMIQDLVDIASAGLYSFAYNVSMILQVIIQAINRSWNPVFFDLYTKKKYNNINILAKKLSKLLFVIALILILFVREIILILADEKYMEALNVVPIVLLSYVFVFLYTLYFQYNSYYKKTSIISLYSIVTLIINVILNYMFIPKYGYIMAAYTTLVSYIILFLLYYMNAKYILKAHIIPIKILVKDLIILIIFSIIYLCINPLISTWIYSLVIRVIIIALYILIVVKGIDKKNNIKWRS